MLGIAVLAVVPASVAMGGSATDRVTGGGQVLIGERGGAGDTIAFTAQDRETNKGQVQYVDREGASQTVLHGTVSCVRVDGERAEISGVWKAEDAGAFHILVVDNGEGVTASGEDIVTVTELDDPSCEEDDEDDDGETALARGNAQVYDADAE